MLTEPFRSEAGHFFERSGLLEQMRSTRDDTETLFATQMLIRLPVELEHDIVLSTEDEQRRGTDAR